LIVCNASFIGLEVVLLNALALAAQGWEVLGITESPMNGAKGNKKFLISGRRS
jgi:predicted rRNA methylase YqxC with S4 and FtsJ domains